MNTILEHLLGLHHLTDQAIATDFLLSSKSAVQNLAVAITEASNPEIRAVLNDHLEEAIASHERIFRYMMDKGHYRPYNIDEQLHVDLRTAKTALDIPS
ncbi:spore coat protein [Paenibacillus sp. DMB20]|uniref:spore coat protein n=1 Tax=Paenibacillus sp. DMB20 TaxID=1642570 RepID=UPI000627A1CF|nr:spore coat protein [Paenibacillus sp. DMB20]KKO53409.1 spore gernimation protein GerQ [Paenibacillus sp. DMB20]